MKWSCHIQVLLVVVADVWVWGLVDRVSLAVHDGLVLGVSCSLGRFLDGSRHFHLSFEVHLRLLVAILPILQLLVPPVNKMVAGSDMVVSIVFNAFLCIFSVKVEFFDDLREQFLFDWHLLFAWE